MYCMEILGKKQTDKSVAFFKNLEILNEIKCLNQIVCISEILDYFT